MVRLAITLLLLILMPSAANAEKRFALLIGNQAYAPAIGALVNPHNDVALLERTLQGLGFEVAVERDAEFVTRAVNAYARRLAAAGPGSVGLLYYSGHGAADGVTNYLIPVDAKSTEDTELWDQSLRLNDITRRLKTEAGKAVHFVVFDACRNVLKLKKAGSRALVQSKGFVPVSQEPGMLVAYATAEGELASDIGEGAGPYAKVLAEEITKPGVEAVTMFRNVQRRVRVAIKQEPYLGFGSLDDVYLAGVKAEETPKPVAAPPPATQLSEAAQTWAAIKDTTNTAVLEAFVTRYKDTFYADLVRARLEEVKKQQVALVGNENRCLKPGSGKTEWFKDCPHCPEMVVVPAGSFTMGSPASEPKRSSSEDPQHKVTIAAAFAVGRFAVTFEEWDACLAAGGCNGYRPSDKGWGRGKQPVINVSWEDAKAYVAWLSKTTGKTYRLLSEAEREYVTRAGTTTPFWWGSSISTGQANYDGNYSYGGGSKGEYQQKTMPMDSFEPNPWGLYQVHGNVYDWVEDCWNDGYQGAPTDGSAWTTGDCGRRVLRGGSWNSDPRGLRAAFRIWLTADGRVSGDVGFRLARASNP